MHCVPDKLDVGFLHVRGDVGAHEREPGVGGEPAEVHLGEVPKGDSGVEIAAAKHVYSDPVHAHIVLSARGQVPVSQDLRLSEVETFEVMELVSHDREPVVAEHA